MQGDEISFIIIKSDVTMDVEIAIYIVEPGLLVVFANWVIVWFCVPSAYIMQAYLLELLSDRVHLVSQGEAVQSCPLPVSVQVGQVKPDTEAVACVYLVNLLVYFV